MAKSKIGRDGGTVVRNLSGGRKLSVTPTPAGVRANLHENGMTRSVDPRAYGISGVSSSVVGAGHRRVTINTTDGQAIDFTRRGGGSIDERIHTDGTSRKK